MCFIDRLTTLMNDRNVSAYKLSKDLEISESLIGKWRKNPNSIPSAMILFKLSEYFLVSMEWLLIGKDSRTNVTCKQTGTIQKDLQRVGINEYLTFDENEALNYFRKLSYREQLVEIGELKIKAQIAEREAAIEDNKTKSSSFDEEVAEEITVSTDANAG